MKNVSSFGKWIAGIIAGVITGVLIWWLTEKKHDDLPIVQQPTVKTDTMAAVICHIEGKVINKDNNQPLANVRVSYFRHTIDKTDYSHKLKARLATTDVDGKFIADCSKIEDENFPLRLHLQHEDWGALNVVTDEYVQKNEVKNHINIYVSHGLQKKLATSLDP